MSEQRRERRRQLRAFNKKAEKFFRGKEYTEENIQAFTEQIFNLKNDTDG